MHDIELVEKEYKGIWEVKAMIHFRGVRLPDVNLYLADGLLIDTGPSILENSVRDFFLHHRITQVALTHIHEDHTGMAAWLQEQLGVPIYLNENSLQSAASPAKLSKYRKYIWGERPAFRALPLPEKMETEHFVLRVIPAPGHHPDHCVFWEEERGWLFSGDLFISEKQDVAFKSENITEAIGTLKMVLALDFDTFFCFHAGIREDGKALLRKKLDNFLQLQAAVADLRRQGLNSWEIDDRLFPTKHIITGVSKGEWSSLNMVTTL